MTALHMLRRRLAYALAVAQVWTLRLTRRRAGVVLMYHRVEPRPGDPAREFTPPVACDAFAAHLRHLRRHFRIVEAATLLPATGLRRFGQRFPIALTFDDDTASHVRYAMPLLREHGVPATFFLNGMALSRPVAYWWERLQAAYDDAGSWETVLPAETLRAAREWAAGGEVQAYHVSEAVERMSVSDRRTLSDRLATRLGGDPPDAGLRSSQVRELTEAGFVVGFHGHHHEPLSLLTTAQMHAELDGGRAQLEEIAGAPLTLVAYPHGKAARREAEAARELGFLAGFTVADEAVTPRSDALLQGRLDAQLPSRARLALRMVEQLKAAR